MSSGEVDDQASEHGQRPITGRLTLAEDDIGQELAQLWSTVRQGNEQVLQWRDAVPVAHQLTEAKDFFKPLAQETVVGRQPAGAETGIERAGHVGGRDPARFEGVVDALAGERIDQAGRLADQQRALGKRRRAQKIDADGVALERSNLACPAGGTPCDSAGKFGVRA